MLIRPGCRVDPKLATVFMVDTWQLADDVCGLSLLDMVIVTYTLYINDPCISDRLLFVDIIYKCDTYYSYILCMVSKS